MLVIQCPWCGMRDESEFHYGGEAHIKRPKNPDALTDQEWGDYLFFRKNTRGLHRELWLHAAGCRQWFNVERDTVSYKIKSTYKVGAQPEESGGLVS